VKRYLSFGGGINSVALMLLLEDQGEDFEAVFADHGADWPETYEYVQMLQDKGHKITVLQCRRKGLALYDYYLEHKMVPMRMVRACTRLYKLVPLAEYMQPPCIVYMGISADESHRAARITAGERDGEEKLFPLIDAGIDRKGCIDIIKAHGLPVPIKSGCFICPFQRISQWVELRTKHPELYCKAKRLENVTNARVQAQGRPPIYLAHDRPLDNVAQEDQMDLFGEREDRPCLCEL